MNEIRELEDGLETFDMDMENKNLFQEAALLGKVSQSQSNNNICDGFVGNMEDHFILTEESQNEYTKHGKLLEVYPISNNLQTELSNQDDTRGIFSKQDMLQDDYTNSDSSLDNKNKPVGVENAARERSRVKTLRGAFLELQRTLPAVPPDTKLSKLDVLVLATTYIAHLMRTLNDDQDDNQLFAAHGIMHPVKKWPMRSRLYAGILSSTFPVPGEGVESRVPWTQRSSRRENRRKSRSYRINPEQLLQQ